MTWYLNKSISFDIVIAFLIMLVFNFYKVEIQEFSTDIDIDSKSNYISSIIAICSTLIGFYLTIITIIVTFKTNLESKESSNSDESESVFDKVISKLDVFKNSNLPMLISSVFAKAAYELTVILLIALLMQFQLIELSKLTTISILLCFYIIICIIIARCFIVFNSFLNVFLK